jgi:hypothetical protein
MGAHVSNKGGLRVAALRLSPRNAVFDPLSFGSAQRGDSAQRLRPMDTGRVRTEVLV